MIDVVTWSYRHDNVVSYKESFIDVATSTICLVMEFAEEGDMLSKVE
jgi:NIMA (never in mitosis gene a)-related kinase